MNEDKKALFSTYVETYKLGGWMRGSKGTLSLYDDEIIFEKGALSFGQPTVIALKDIESIQLTKVSGFLNQGICINSRNGEQLKVYTKKRVLWEPYLKEYIK